MSQTQQIDLTINKLTKQQYESIQNPTSTDLYLVIDDNGISSADVTNALGYTPQQQLVSGTNIKTINNTSLLGSGNIDIQGGGTVTVDSALSTTSENPVQNKVITTEVNKKLENTATGTGGLTVGGTASDRTAATNIGVSSVVSANNTIALGYNAQATSPYSTTIGRNSKTSGASSIQIGYGTNSTANTLSIGFYNTSSTHYNWTLLDGTTGLIPTDRINVATSVSSSSTNAQVVGAKLLYDIVQELKMDIYLSDYLDMIISGNYTDLPLNLTSIYSNDLDNIIGGN